MPALYALYVINKSGGLIYYKEFVPIASLNLNDTLRLASIWHSLHAIAAQLSPAQGCTGIDLLLTETFDLHCFQTLTGTKFLLVVEPRTPDVAELLRTTIYELYTDYVLKNPHDESQHHGLREEQGPRAEGKDKGKTIVPRSVKLFTYQHRQ
ncbi:hypothetical protein WJX74_007988 [Apatococcus lobatus]|uniref:Trafficking protein particle complex subunit n=1 Tax=Apatococcus lobatus TaxID=904363 RepID=A0AAW1RBK1_9CHLO